MTQSELQEALYYNPDTGEFRWRMSGRGRRPNGIAGCQRRDGYRLIFAGDALYYAHRLAWLYVYGAWPKYDIDHLNGDKSDNRIKNLRDVSRLVNKRNCELYANSPSGCSGVYFRKDIHKWSSAIKCDGRTVYLGVFVNKCDAVSARKKAERDMGYSAVHGLTRQARIDHFKETE